MNRTEPVPDTPPTAPPAAAAPVSVTSFGYLHGPPPEAHVVLDLRAHFRDPHVDPRLRHLTARDRLVRDAVMATPGIPALVDAVVSAVSAYQAGPGGGPVAVAVGCAGGRHRAATVAVELAARVGGGVAHRDLDKPVVARSPGGYARHYPEDVTAGGEG